MTSSRIGFAQTDCMSPVLGAVASVMTVFEGFEDRPKFTVPAGRGAVGENGTRRRNSASRDGRQIRGRDRSEKDRFNRGASDLAQAAWRASETIVSRIDSASALASSLGRPGARMRPLRVQGSSGNPSARPRTLRPGPTTEAGRIVAANPARNTVPMALKFLE